MTHLLHDRDALIDVASTFHEPAASWARNLLAIWHRELPAGLPRSDRLWEPALLATASLAPGAALQALQDPTPPSEGLAISLADVERYGLHLGPSGPLSQAIHAHVGQAGLAEPWLAELLWFHGELTPRALQAAVAARDSAYYLVKVPALAIRYGVESGQGPEIVGETLSKLPAQVAFTVVVDLVPSLPVPTPGGDLDEVLRYGAERVGLSLPLSRVRGSERRRAATWIKLIARDRTDLFAIACRSLMQHHDFPVEQLIPLAHLLLATTPAPMDNPVQAVVEHYRSDPNVLRQARQQVAESGPGEWGDLAQSWQAGNLGAGLLCLQVDPAALAARAPEVLQVNPNNFTLDMSAAALPWWAEHLPELIESPYSREAGLLLACAAPTSEVAETLLGLPVPHHPYEQDLYVYALATMGSPDCAARARAIVETVPEIDSREPVALLDALHL